MSSGLRRASLWRSRKQAPASGAQGEESNGNSESVQKQHAEQAPQQPQPQQHQEHHEHEERQRPQQRATSVGSDEVLAAVSSLWLSHTQCTDGEFSVDRFMQTVGRTSNAQAGGGDAAPPHRMLSQPEVARTSPTATSSPMACQSHEKRRSGRSSEEKLPAMSDIVHDKQASLGSGGGASEMSAADRRRALRVARKLALSAADSPRSLHGTREGPGREVSKQRHEFLASRGAAEGVRSSLSPRRAPQRECEDSSAGPTAAAGAA